MKKLLLATLILTLALLTACGGTTDAPAAQNEAAPQGNGNGQAQQAGQSEAAPQGNGNGQKEDAGSPGNGQAVQETAPQSDAQAGAQGANGNGQGPAKLSEDFNDALPIRNQLTLGLLELENDSALAVSPEQAAKILPLWQVLDSLTQSGTSAQAEIDALLKQIQGELTPEQMAAIAAMQLTREDTQRVAQEWGLSVGQGGGEGGGQGRNMTEEERATRRAQEGNTDAGKGNPNGISVVLLERLLQMLAERAG